jgi:uncharacterized repeat protein (TIGR01451 family)
MVQPVKTVRAQQVYGVATITQENGHINFLKPGMKLNQGDRLDILSGYANLQLANKVTIPMAANEEFVLNESLQLKNLNTKKVKSLEKTEEQIIAELEQLAAPGAGESELSEGFSYIVNDFINTMGHVTSGYPTIPISIINQSSQIAAGIPFQTIMTPEALFSGISQSQSTSVDVVLKNPNLAINKQAISVNRTDSLLVEKAGDVITYQITIENTGDVDLSDIMLVDVMLGLNETLATLLKGQEKSYFVEYTVTQQDIDKGISLEEPLTQAIDIENIVHADSSQTDTISATETVALLLNPDIEVIKNATAVNGSDDVLLVKRAGDVISYEINVSNTGNQSLSHVDVNDSLIADLQFAGGDINHNQRLDVGETWVYRGDYTVTQQDIDSQLQQDSDIDNIATAYVLTPQGQTLDDSDEEHVNIKDINPQLSFKGDAFSLDERYLETGSEPHGQKSIYYLMAHVAVGNQSISKITLVLEGMDTLIVDGQPLFLENIDGVILIHKDTFDGPVVLTMELGQFNQHGDFETITHTPSPNSEIDYHVKVTLTDNILTSPLNDDGRNLVELLISSNSPVRLKITDSSGDSASDVILGDVLDDIADINALHEAAITNKINSLHEDQLETDRSSGVIVGADLPGSIYFTSEESEPVLAKNALGEALTHVGASIYLTGFGTSHLHGTTQEGIDVLSIDLNLDMQKYTIELFQTIDNLIIEHTIESVSVKPGNYDWLDIQGHDYDLLLRPITESETVNPSMAKKTGAIGNNNNWNNSDDGGLRFDLVQGFDDANGQTNNNKAPIPTEQLQSYFSYQFSTAITDISNEQATGANLDSATLFFKASLSETMLSDDSQAIPITTVFINDVDAATLSDITLTQIDDGIVIEGLDEKDIITIETEYLFNRVDVINYAAKLNPQTLEQFAGDAYRLSSIMEVDVITEMVPSLSLPFEVKDADGDIDNSILNIDFLTQSLIVGTNADDKDSSTVMYHIGQGQGVIHGSLAGDILIGDIGGEQGSDLKAVGDDIIKGHEGDDTIFGDSPYNEELGITGIESFEEKESASLNWSRQDTKDFMTQDSERLTEDAPREGGDDVLEGGAGDDIIYGQEGDDLISGGIGADTLDAGSGENIIDAGIDLSEDHLIFQLSELDQHNVVKNFNPQSDRITFKTTESDVTIDDVVDTIDVEGNNLRVTLSQEYTSEQAQEPVQITFEGVIAEPMIMPIESLTSILPNITIQSVEEI